MTSIEWFYAQEGRQFGPITPEELRRMAEEGELATTDLVWREGLPEWVPAIRVRGLFDTVRSVDAEEEHVYQQTVSAAVPVEEAAVRAPVAPRPLRTPSNHPLSAVLAWYRDTFHARRIASLSAFFDAMGHFALYAFMFLCLVLGGAVSAQSRELVTLGLALAGVLAIFVLQYTARRMNAEIRERLVVEPLGDSASRGVSDTVALWSMTLGLLLFVVFVVLTVYGGGPILFVDGVCLFVLFQFFAITAASPEVLGLTPPDDVTLGGQAIGIPKLAAKLLLAAVPIVFGLAAVWGCISMIYALVLLFTAENPVAYVGIALQAYPTTAAFAALPLFAVALFSFAVAIVIRLLEKIVE